jgi:hypothetical protein
LRRQVFGAGDRDQVVAAETGEGWLRMDRGPLTVVMAHTDSPVVLPMAGEIMAAFGDARLESDAEEGPRLVLGPHSVVIVRH